MLSEENLKEIRHNLAHLSLPAVRDFYDQAYRDCRLAYNKPPQPAPDPDARASVEAIVEVALSWVTVLGGAESDRVRRCARIKRSRASSPLGECRDLASLR
jgi:hypothetical protein